MVMAKGRLRTETESSRPATSATFRPLKRGSRKAAANPFPAASTANARWARVEPMQPRNLPSRYSVMKQAPFSRSSGAWAAGLIFNGAPWARPCSMEAAAIPSSVAPWAFNNARVLWAKPSSSAVPVAASSKTQAP